MKNHKKGFTLAELLIVLAILAVLIAIAIPAYSAQLESAKVKVDEANLRAAESMASASYLLGKADGTPYAGTAYFVVAAQGTGTHELTLSTTVYYNGDGANTTDDAAKAAAKGAGAFEGKAEINKTKFLIVEVVDGGTPKGSYETKT